MAFIPGYTYDLFISYAHLDNEKLPGQQEGWIELFYKSLQLKLAQRIGKMDAVKIWWDSRKLDGSILFDHSIEEGINQSAIMISLVSPGYLGSDYCKKELNQFYTKAKAEPVGLKVGDYSRLVKVMLNNIPYTQWPDVLSGSTGFPFYKARDKEDFGDPLDSTNPLFMDQIKALRDSIVRIFEQFTNAGTVPATSASSDIPTQVAEERGERKFHIYFGEVADSLRTARKRTINELEKNGYTILTGVPPPDEATAHEEKVKAVLQKADLAVHLLDQFPGREISGDSNNWYPKKQAELSLASATPKLLWVPSDTDLSAIEEDGYRSFMEGLEQTNTASVQLEYLRGAKSEITRQVSELAEAIQLSRSQAGSNEKISVLLDTHFSDQQYAFDFGRALLDQDIQPYINPQEDDPRKNINLLSERIRQVNKLIFFYGKVSREWVLERMSAALQLIVTNNYPVEDFYIFLAPPNKNNDEIKLKQRFLKINVLNNSINGGSDNERLNNFIQTIKGTKV
jgi:TIR domain